jgi:hypothetical protein
MNRQAYYQKAAAIVAAYAGFHTNAARQFLSAQAVQEDITSNEFLNITDLLPQLSEIEIRDILSRLGASKAKCFIVVSTYYSDLVLQSGENLHKTVQPAEWWLNIFRTYFEKTSVLQTFQKRDSDVVVTNFPVSSECLKSLSERSVSGTEVERLFLRISLFARVASGRTVSQKRLLEDLRDKSVALVGNARSLGDSSYGREIDSHDLVIRLNRAPIVSRRSHGYRTDWAAVGVPLDQRRLNELGAKRLLWLSPFRRKIPAETASVENLYVHPVSEMKALASAASVERPSTGLVAIDLLRKSACRSVVLYGFDFYESKSSSSHQTKETAPHAFDREEDFVRALLSTDPRFELRR